MLASRSALLRDLSHPALTLGPLLLGVAITLASAANAQTTPAVQPTDAAGTAATDQQAGDAAAGAADTQPAIPGAAAGADVPPAKPDNAGAAVTTSTAPQPKPAQGTSSDAAAGGAAAGPAATAELADPNGKQMGSITVQDTPSGMLHVSFVLKDLPAGTRAMHIHEVGKCEGPAFESAGGHLAGGKEHGALTPGGPHIGDMPNITPAADGSATGELFLSGPKVADVLDDDGSAVIVHAKADDYASQPSGAAGDRVACGVFTAAR